MAVHVEPHLRRFVATQPILNKSLEAIGYELLFRSGLEEVFTYHDGDLASQAMLDSVLLVGMETLTRGRPAFVNCTRAVLQRRLLTLLPKELVVAEILGDVHADAEIRQACSELRQNGYSLALHFSGDAWQQNETGTLLPFASFVKVNLCNSSEAQHDALFRAVEGTDVKLIAQAVESRAQYENVRGRGFEYFQGFFFCKPEVISSGDIPANKLNYLPLLKAIHAPEIRIEELEECIRREPALTYRLLRCLNSPAFGFRSEIRSIRHALTLMGERQLRKWITITAVGSMGIEKPAELVITSLVRGRFCELLAGLMRMHDRKPDLFLMGMLSLMDAILERPLPKLLQDLPILSEIKNGLLGEDNAYRRIFNIAVAYEKADWPRLRESTESLRLDEDEMPGIYQQALQWARNVHTE
jgi:EAL and modified HD-GYP domain-containing signal transduction protein